VSPSPRTPVALVAALAATALAAQALAEQKTSIQVLVASVSTEGKHVDRELASMERDLKRLRLPFTSFKLVKSASLSLTAGQTDSVSLPNGTAQFTVVSQDGQSARVKIATPFLTSTYTMTPGGEIYIDAGARGATKVYLAVKR
jgi:hypothetical protein